SWSTCLSRQPNCTIWGGPFFYVLKKLIYQVLNTTNNYEIGSYREIAKEINEIDVWADLEYQIGQLTNGLEKKDVERFLEDFIELNEDLDAYLKEEQLKETVKIDDLSNIVEHTINNFYVDLRPEDKRKVTKLLTNLDTIHTNFITFNYTNLLSIILENCKTKSFKNRFSTNYNFKLPQEVTYAHGKIGNMVTLGVNDESQFNSKVFNTEDSIYLIKPKSLDLNREDFKNLAVDRLKGSSIVNVFGMSIGVTDKYWWNLIGNILIEDSKRVLIIHEFLNAPNSPSPLKVHQIRKEIENRFLNQLDFKHEEKEKIRKQIVISYKSGNILNVNLSMYKNVSKNSNILMKVT
ncbi:AbiH family protein, partial [Alkalibacterium sp. m-11]